MRPLRVLLCALFMLILFAWPMASARAETLVNVAPDDAAPANAAPKEATPTSAELEGITPMFAALGTPSPSEDIVGCEDDLLQWLSDHEQTGGTVYLEDDVSVTSPFGVFMDEDQNVLITINTGANSLIYESGYIEGVGVKILITGEGVNSPVLDVVDMGRMFIGSANAILSRAYITATGKDGQGGTAMRVLDLGSNMFDTSFAPAQGKIVSHGAAAVGIEFLSPVDAYCFNVEVSGENAVAVKAPSGMNLFFCKLAAGEGASAVSDGDILLDGCMASRVPESARVITRLAEASPYFSSFYLPVARNAPSISYYPLCYPTEIALAGSDGSTISYSFAFIWDEAMIESIDTSVPGTTRIYCAYDPPFMGLGIFDSLTPTAFIEVRDPALPCIASIIVSADDSSVYTTMNLWTQFTYDQDVALILWRSDDKGGIWYKVAAEEYAVDIPVFSYEDIKILYDYARSDNETWLQIERVGVGFSNPVSIFFHNGLPFCGFPGDRTGDRVIKDDQPSPPFLPPPNLQGRTGASLPMSAPLQQPVAQSAEPPTPYGAPDVRPAQSTVGETPAKDSGPEEWEDANGMGVSGKRLSVMLEANPQTVTIIKQGVQIGIPTEALRALGIEEDQLFAIHVEKQDDGFIITFTLDGEPITLPFAASVGGAPLRVSGSLAMPAAQPDAAVSEGAGQSRASETRPEALPAQALPAPRKAAFPLWAGLTIGGVALGGGPLIAFRRAFGKAFRRVFQR